MRDPSPIWVLKRLKKSKQQILSGKGKRTEKGQISDHIVFHFENNMILEDAS